MATPRPHLEQQDACTWAHRMNSKRVHSVNEMSEKKTHRVKPPTPVWQEFQGWIPANGFTFTRFLPKAGQRSKY